MTAKQGQNGLSKADAKAKAAKAIKELEGVVDRIKDDADERGLKGRALWDWISDHYQDEIYGHLLKSLKGEFPDEDDREEAAEAVLLEAFPIVVKQVKKGAIMTNVEAAKAVVAKLAAEQRAKTAEDGKLDIGKVEKNLSDEVSKIIGKKVKLDVKLGPKGLLVTSPDLSDAIGVRLFKSLHVKSFNYGINDKAELAEDEARYWVTLHYEWEYYGHGTNGTGIAAFWLTDDGDIKQVRSELK